jgi:hypothetical protein
LFGVQLIVPAHAAAPGGGHADQQVTAALGLVHHAAAGGHAKSFFRTTMGFQFGHFILFRALFGSQHQNEAVSQKLGIRFNHGLVGQLLFNLFDDIFAEVAVFHFAAVEQDDHADFIAFRQKFIDESELRHEIVLADFRAEAHFFDVAALLVLFGLFALLFLFVSVFRKIQYFTNGRHRAGSDLNKIMPSVFCDTYSFGDRFYSELRAIEINETDLGGADLRVKARFRDLDARGLL